MHIAVKVCGLTRSSDVHAAISAGVDAFGIVFDRGACCVPESTAQELLRAAQGAPIERVAVVGEAGLASCRRMWAMGFDVVQAVASEELMTAGLDFVVPAFFDGDDVEQRVQAWRTENPALSIRRGSLRGAINIDGAGGGGTGSRADWRRSARIAAGGATILSGGLRVENLAEAVQTVQPHAVDVSSGVETHAGVKSPQLMRAFVAEVRRLEAALGEVA